MPINSSSVTKLATELTTRPLCDIIATDYKKDSNLIDFEDFVKDFQQVLQNRPTYSRIKMGKSWYQLFTEHKNLDDRPIYPLAVQALLGVVEESTQNKFLHYVFFNSEDGEPSCNVFDIRKAIQAVYIENRQDVIEKTCSLIEKHFSFDLDDLPQLIEALGGLPISQRDEIFHHMLQADDHQAIYAFLSRFSRDDE